MDKELARKEAKLNRNKLTQKEVYDLSLVICNAVEKLQEYKKAKYIFMYMPLGNEVSTMPLLEKLLDRDEVTVAFPKVIGKKMEFFIVNSLCEFDKGCYNIMEPISTCQKANIKAKDAIMIMPGVAFDMSGSRVGYGGGFYDKYIASGFMGTKIALAYDFQVYSSIKTDTFDQKCDIIVTEKNTYYSRKMIER